jgi:hypothetical protein
MIASSAHAGLPVSAELVVVSGADCQDVRHGNTPSSAAAELPR